MSILHMNNISKSFPGVKALDNVNFKVDEGEIHALCGENGAGKSTLMKILSGVHPSDSHEGDVYIHDQKQHFESIRDSEAAGITIIYQELALVEELSVAENIFLGNEPVHNGMMDWNRMHDRTKRLLDYIGLTIPSNEKVKNLGVGRQQLIEIAKALEKQSSLIILDEPTAALAEGEVDILMSILEDLKSKGITCIYISHKLKEVLHIADSITILRDGKTIETIARSEADENRIIASMVGRELTELFPYQNNSTDHTILSVMEYSFLRKKDTDPMVYNISFELKKGEVLGIGGLMGSGRTELAMSLFGSYEGEASGSVYLNNEPVTLRSPKEAVGHGIGYVSEDRKRYGLVTGMDVSKNTTLSSLSHISWYGILNKEQEVFNTRQVTRKMGVKTPSLQTIVNKLSGGNQQKVVLSKWLLTSPDILILDEPTRGIDVGAKQEIYHLINELTSEGVAIIMITSELSELIGMSDRIMVMAEHTTAGEVNREDADQETIMKLATGGSVHAE
ncbi:sugar ABC transporter ATP-binding protein [Salibacterium halotolerans]|uniref:D-xylose transport system ATP-binding protein n=1 Tax=Salibacterium halotolerans TaxID=1884432 RepID=A0A1I5L2V9_9BACI|nr:ATP-binding cassette domain-containing protein [Salibacterium halotolerans]SFO91492.1 D-xylose transport system ATP-binding protein [Salibacterium halotolerans]